MKRRPSLAHPGGNLTGQFLDAPSLCSKWLQQIRGVLVNVTRIAILWDEVPNARRDLLEAMKQVAETGHGPANQTPSMGCSIKWKD
jgi:hypothetical protein